MGHGLLGRLVRQLLVETFVSASPGRAPLCFPKEAELVQAPTTRRENSGRTTVPSSGVCWVAQLARFKAMCGPENSSIERECQQPGGPMLVEYGLICQFFKDSDAKMIENVATVLKQLISY